MGSTGSLFPLLCSCFPYYAVPGFLSFQSKDNFKFVLIAVDKASLPISKYLSKTLNYLSTFANP